MAIPNVVEGPSAAADAAAESSLASVPAVSFPKEDTASFPIPFRLMPALEDVCSGAAKEVDGSAQSDTARRRNMLTAKLHLLMLAR